MYRTGGFSTILVEKFDNQEGEHVKKHKYMAVDNSPLSRYVLHPFWNTVVKVVPKRVHPNLLTISGFFLLVVAFIIMWRYDCDFNGLILNSQEHERTIPTWAWYLAGVLIFFSHTLDGIDGKQARRLKVSSPVGEFMDHGTDSMAMVIIPMIISSGIGLANEETSRIQAISVFLILIFNFYISHWEKYVTGVLFLPWTYDAIMLTCSIYMVTLGVTNGELLGQIGIPLQAAYTFLKLGIIGFTVFVNVPLSVVSVVRFVRQNRCESRSFWDCISPMANFFIFSVISIAYVCFSQLDVVERRLRVVFLLTGLIFSNMTCRLIVCQICKRKYEFANVLFLLPIFITAALILGASKWIEDFLLHLSVLFVTIAHFVYFVSVVARMGQAVGASVLFIDRQ